jgi:hypothetical protein
VDICSSTSYTEEFSPLAGRMIPLHNGTRWNSWYKLLVVADEHACDGSSHACSYRCPRRGQFQGAVPRGCTQGRQLVYIESYAPPLLPSSSLLSLVSSISAIYKAPFYSNSILYVPSHTSSIDTYTKEHFLL